MRSLRGLFSVILFLISHVLLAEKYTYFSLQYYDGAMHTDYIAIDTKGEEKSYNAILKDVEFCPKGKGWFCTNALSGLAFPKDKAIKYWSFWDAQYERLSLYYRDKIIPTPFKSQSLFKNKKIYFVKETYKDNEDDYRIFILSERFGLLGFLQYIAYKCREFSEKNCSLSTIYIVDRDNGLGSSEFDNLIDVKQRDPDMIKDIRIGRILR